MQHNIDWIHVAFSKTMTNGAVMLCRVDVERIQYSGSTVERHSSKSDEAGGPELRGEVNSEAILNLATTVFMTLKLNVYKNP